MNSLLKKLETENVPIEFSSSMCMGILPSIGLINPLCTLSHIEAIVLLLIIRINRELIIYSISFLFDLDRMNENDSLLIYIIYCELLLLCLSFPGFFILLFYIQMLVSEVNLLHCWC